MFALTNVRIATVFSLSALAASTGCSTEQKTSGPDDKSMVEAFLAEDAHAVTALELGANGGYDFDVELATGKLVITIAADDQSPLVAPLTFDPSSMWTFIGRGEDFKIGQVELEQAARWITDSEVPALCASRKLDSLASVTFADGSQHAVSVGINYVKDKSKRIDVSNGGCPVPGNGRAACNGAKCELGVSIKGFDLVLSGTCQYGELTVPSPFPWGGDITIWRNCLCDVILPDLGGETGETTTEQPTYPDGTGTGSNY